MSIPLVQNNDKDSINTSLNAIKRNLDRINSMLGLVDNTTAGMENEIALLQPVDTVASGNLHSVTSNAVALNTPVKKNIAYSYTGSPANLEEIIKQIIENQLNYQTTETNTYAGQISSTHTGSGDFGTWNGTYIINVVKNALYGTTGFVSAQGYGFSISLNNGNIVVKRFLISIN